MAHVLIVGAGPGGALLAHLLRSRFGQRRALSAGRSFPFGTTEVQLRV